MAEYSKLTVKHALGLAAPYSWPASIFPVLLGAALAVAINGSFSWPLFALLLAASVLMQASANTINDYYDFIKVNGRLEDSDAPGGAILAHNALDPRQVRRLGYGFMAAAVLLGLYPVYRGGLVTLLSGLCGCAVAVAYSAGRKPLSHLPVGEIVSGTVMGGLITLAVFSVFTGQASPRILLLSAPLIMGIGLIMMTNNICDIERDAPSGRCTLPLLLGRSRARILYLGCACLWLLLAVACVALRFRGGLLPLCLLLAAAFPVWRRMARLPLTPQQRGPCMGMILLANLCANTAYVAAILLHAFLN